MFVHIIEEYARHNGHADLLRRIDSRGPGMRPDLLGKLGTANRTEAVTRACQLSLIS